MKWMEIAEIVIGRSKSTPPPATCLRRNFVPPSSPSEVSVCCTLRDFRLASHACAASAVARQTLALQVHTMAGERRRRAGASRRLWHIVDLGAPTNPLANIERRCRVTPYPLQYAFREDGAATTTVKPYSARVPASEASLTFDSVFAFDSFLLIQYIRKSRRLCCCRPRCCCQPRLQEPRYMKCERVGPRMLRLAALRALTSIRSL